MVGEVRVGSFEGLDTVAARVRAELCCSWYGEIVWRRRGVLEVHILDTLKGVDSHVRQ